MDNILESNETFKAVLSVPAGVPRVSEGTPSEATVTILDQTAAEVYFDPDIYCVPEGQSAELILKLTMDVDPSVTIIVRVQTMDGTAIGVYIRIRVISSTYFMELSPTQACTERDTVCCSYELMYFFFIHCRWS